MAAQPTAPDETAIDILLIEDTATQSQLGHMLHKRGYRVLAATDGIKGLLQTRTSTPRLIVVDVPLPGLSGFHVMSMIRQSPHLADVPVIMLTRPDHSDDRQRALELGADSTISRLEAERQLYPAIQKLFKRCSDAQPA